MSIIADALKKAEASSEILESPPPPPPPSSTPLWAYRAALVGGVGIVLLGIAHFTQPPGRAATRAVSSETVKTAAAKSAPAMRLPNVSASAANPTSETPVQRLLQLAQTDLALNGVVESGDGRSLALINNQVLQEGDQIRGMRVVRVNPKSVEMQDAAGKTKTLELKD